MKLNNIILRFKNFLSGIRKKKSNLFFVFIVTIFVLTIIFIVCRFVKVNSEYNDTMSRDVDSSKELMITADDVKINENTGVPAWLQAYLNYDFDTCDQLVNPDSYRFNNYVYEHGIEAHKQMYMLMQGKAVDAVDSIDVYDVKHENSQNIYYVRVSCKRYKIPSGVSIDAETYEDLCSDFVQGSLTVEEFEQELTKLYLSWLSDCFDFNTDEIVTFECQLIDYTDEDIGLLEVADTSDFISRVLSETGVLKVEQIYEYNLSKELEKVLVEY